MQFHPTTLLTIQWIAYTSCSHHLHMHTHTHTHETRVQSPAVFLLPWGACSLRICRNKYHHASLYVLPIFNVTLLLTGITLHCIRPNHVRNRPTYLWEEEKKMDPRKTGSGRSRRGEGATLLILFSFFLPSPRRWLAARPGAQNVLTVL